MPDLIKAALALQKERAAGGKGAPAKKNITTQKKETVHPDSFILGLTGQDDDAPRVPKTKKAAEVDKRLRLEAEAAPMQQAKTTAPQPAPARQPEPVHPDFFIRSFTGQDNRYEPVSAWQSEEDEALYVPFQQGLLSLLNTTPPSLKPVEPRYRYIPEINEPKGKVYAERDIDAHVPLWGIERERAPWGGIIQRRMTIGEAKASRKEDELRLLPYEQEQQRNLTARKTLARVVNWIASGEPGDQAAREQLVNAALLDPSYRPVAGVDPKWLTDLHNAMELNGGNNVIRGSIRSKKFTDRVNQLLSSGVPEEQIIKALMESSQGNAVPLNEFTARDLLAQSAIDAQRIDPEFLTRIPLEAANHINTAEEDEPWTASERIMLAHLYSTGGQEAVDEYRDLMHNTLVLRRAVEKSANLSGQAYEVLLPAMAAGAAKVVKGVVAFFRLAAGDTEPMKLWQVEADAEAYISRLDTEDAKTMIKAISKLAEIGTTAALSYINPALGTTVGTFSSIGGTYQDELASGASRGTALNNAGVSAVINLIPLALTGLLAPDIVPSIPTPRDPFWTALTKEGGGALLEDIVTDFYKIKK